MGRVMKRNTRRGLIIFIALLLLGSAGLTAWWFKQPLERKKEVPVYTCHQQARVDYQVFFIPNKFFPEPSAGPGRAYITPLTQYIQTVLNYSFSGDTPVDISGQYQVDAVLTGYVLKESNDSKGMEREKVKVWEKTWAVLPPTPFSAQDRKLEVKQAIPVDIRPYINFADQITQELKYSADLVEINIRYNVQGGAVTPQGEIKEPLEAVMVIPVKGSAFMVEGMLADKKEKSITKSKTEAVPGVKTARTGFAISTGVLALLLLLVIFKTTAQVEEPVEKELRKIIRKYGDRIAAGTSRVPDVYAGNNLVMNSFEDLVKVADEVGQPILYENICEGIHSFYIINDPLVYNYTLEGKLPGGMNIKLDENKHKLGM